MNVIRSVPLAANLKSKTSRWYAQINEILLSFYRLYGARPVLSTLDAGGTVTMAKGKVLKLEEASGGGVVQLIHGKVWITTTPGVEDIILLAGEKFPLSGGWPVVIEALEESEITVNGCGMDSH